MAKPILAITMGDPAGVGPEVIARVWNLPSVHQLAHLLVVGSPRVMRRACKRFNGTVRVVSRASVAECVAVSVPGCLPCIPAGSDEAADVAPGKHSAAGGQAAYEAVDVAVELALAGKVGGIVTAPISKAALWEAGHHYPGHTELLAERCGVRDFAMMLYLSPGGMVQGRVGLGVAHVTLHQALRDVPQSITTGAVLGTARLACRAGENLLAAAGVDDRPRVGICALNPHAGEQGLFGDEESQIIAPAVHQGLDEGLNLIGPLPADTLLMRAAAGEFDIVVAMYHDQGHIALKLLGMHRAVNVTLGLPIVRTSVAHGTAFDLAWQGVAQTTGMMEAISAAARLVHLRNKVARV